jgi:4-hydroxy-tetrahydrodipicolinate synthase
MFEGIYTALITPFRNQNVDFESLGNLIKWQLESGVDGFVINGTTAESPTLEEKEVEEIWRFVKEKCPKNFPLILGTGSNSTKKTIQKTKKAEQLGAQGALVVVPYYNKPTQEGMYLHFSEVAASCPHFPILLYNVPGRTVVSMAANTVKRLNEIKNIVGIKEASGNMALGEEILANVKADFTVTSGDDVTCMNLMARGAKGVISVISHVIPKELKAISLLAREKNPEYEETYQKFLDLNKLLGAEPNPIPVKMALFQMGIINSPELRLPLTTMTQENSNQLKSSLKRLGVI